MKDEEGSPSLVPCKKAAFGIGLRLQIFCTRPGWVIGNANATFVGQNLGAKNPGRYKNSTWVAIKVYTIILGASVIYVGDRIAYFVKEVIPLRDA